MESRTTVLRLRPICGVYTLHYNTHEMKIFSVCVWFCKSIDKNKHGTHWAWAGLSEPRLVLQQGRAAEGENAAFSSFYFFLMEHVISKIFIKDTNIWILYSSKIKSSEPHLSVSCVRIAFCSAALLDPGGSAPGLMGFPLGIQRDGPTLSTPSSPGGTVAVVAAEPTVWGGCCCCSTAGFTKP